MKRQKWTVWIASLALGLLTVHTVGITPAHAEAASQTAPAAPSVVTIAGNGQFGEDNGAALSASFRTPMGIAIHLDGTVYVSDTKSHLIRKLLQGTVSTYAGVTISTDVKGFPIGTLFDGALNQSLFQSPEGITLDQQGNLYVADSGNHSIRKITAQGVVTIAGDGIMGYQNGTGQQARFHSPSDIAVAKDGTIYVADTLNHVIRKITPNGAVTTLNSPSTRLVEISPGYYEKAGDFQDGPLASAKFNEPSSLYLDAKGNLYVSDTGNQRIRYIDLNQNTVTTVAGDTSLTYAPNSLYIEGNYADGDAAKAQFQFPRGLAMTSEGGLVIADSQNHVIRYLHNGKVTTLAGTAGKFGSQSGAPANAQFYLPVDVAVDQQNTIWVVDSFNNTLRQLKLK